MTLDLTTGHPPRVEVRLQCPVCNHPFTIYDVEVGDSIKDALDCENCGRSIDALVTLTADFRVRTKIARRSSKMKPKPGAKPRRRVRS